MSPRRTSPLRHTAPRCACKPLAAALLAAFPMLPLMAQETANLPEVKVTGNAESAYRASGASLGALGDRSLQDTPFSVEVVTQELLKNRQATTLLDAFKSDPSVTPAGNGYIGEASAITIRGLMLDLLNGFKFDGLSAVNYGSDLPLEHFERLELLKGSSGFMYGLSAPGGIVNYVLKRPTNEPVRSVTLGLANKSVWTKQADIGGRFGDNDRFGYRVNLVDERGDTFVDSGKIRRTSGSAAFDVRVTPGLVWQFDALQQTRRVDGASFGVLPWQIYGITPAQLPGFGAPAGTTAVTSAAAIDGSTRLAQPNTYYETKFSIYGTNLTWAMAPNWDLRLGYRQVEQLRENADSAQVLFNSTGRSTEVQTRSLSRYFSRTLDAMALGRVSTGGVKHELAFGVSTVELTRAFPTTTSQILLGTGNIYNPVLLAPRVTQPNDRFVQNLRILQSSLFASDSLQFDDQWSAIIGVRYNRFRQNTNAANRIPTEDVRRPVTPTLALLYKPVPSTTFYTSYVESLQAGSVAPLTATVNRNETLPPLMSRQLEAGVKFTQENWSASAAAFRLRKGLETTIGGLFQQAGTEVYQGVEASAKARLARDWTVLGGAMLLNTRNESPLAAINGRRTAGAPRSVANAHVEYAVAGLPGLVLSGGVNYTGDRPLDAGNTFMLDGFTTVDLGARYKTKIGGSDVTWRFNVDNVTKEKYWLPSFGSILVPGAPVTARLSAQIDF